MKPTLYAILHTETPSHGFKSLRISIRRQTQFGEHELFSACWQSDTENRGWYAETIKTDIDKDHAERLAAALAFLRKHPMTDNPGEWAKGLGIPWAVYDARVSEYVTLDRLMAPDMRRYIVRGADCCCMFQAFAADADGARIALERAAGAYVADGAGYGFGAQGRAIERVAQWVKDGCPFEVDSRANPPKVPDLETAFLPLSAERLAVAA